MVHRLMLPCDLAPPIQSEQIRRLVPNFDGKLLVEEVVEALKPVWEDFARFEHNQRGLHRLRGLLIGSQPLMLSSEKRRA